MEREWESPPSVSTAGAALLDAVEGSVEFEDVDVRFTQNAERAALYVCIDDRVD